jgi:hypothetical protein
MHAIALVQDRRGLAVAAESISWVGAGAETWHTGGGAISHSQRNDRYGTDCGRSRGGLGRGDIRPFETIAIHSVTDGPRPKGDVRADATKVRFNPINGYSVSRGNPCSPYF